MSGARALVPHGRTGYVVHQSKKQDGSTSLIARFTSSNILCSNVRTTTNIRPSEDCPARDRRQPACTHYTYTYTYARTTASSLLLLLDRRISSPFLPATYRAIRGLLRPLLDGRHLFVPTHRCKLPCIWSCLHTLSKMQHPPPRTCGPHPDIRVLQKQHMAPSHQGCVRACVSLDGPSTHAPC